MISIQPWSGRHTGDRLEKVDEDRAKHVGARSESEAAAHGPAQ